MTQNQIAYFSAKEQQRHNLQMEGETARHNVATENIQSETNTINRTHLNRMDDETYRHNLQTEEATRRELGIREANLELGIRAQAETERHNRMSESLISSELSETIRHNRVGETQTAAVNNANIALTNAKTVEQQFTNSVNAETRQSQVNTIVYNAGTARYNRDITAWNAQTGGINTASRIIGTILGGAKVMSAY